MFENQLLFQKSSEKFKLDRTISICLNCRLRLRIDVLTNRPTSKVDKIYASNIVYQIMKLMK